MKKIFIIIIGCITISNNAQTIKSIYDDKVLFEENVYYKDLYNDMNKFVGTWVYENGTTKITLVLQKRLQVYCEDYNHHVDEVIGGYKYEVNNEVIVNTIPEISTTKKLFENTISGYSIVKNYFPPACANCPPNDKRLYLHWKEPLATYLIGHMIMRYYQEFDVDYLEVKIYDETSIIPQNATIEETRLPLGNYIFEKQ